jgi:hypothetical protein
MGASKQGTLLMVANREEWRGYKKEDKTSTTVHNESVFTTIVIDAKEGRDVMILDIPGLFFMH